MQSPLVQMIALTCYGNAALSGHVVSRFFPDHSTCKFCDSIGFIAAGPPKDGERQLVPIADTPDHWFAYLSKKNAIGLRLSQKAQNHPQISDRMSAGFVGGGRQWKIEALRRDGTSEFWFGKWELWNKTAPENRIWKVTYGLCEIAQTQPVQLRSLEAIIGDLRPTLDEIRAFSDREQCGGFTKCFEDALLALQDPQADIGYHKDLFLPDTLEPAAISLLKAAMSAWVFGGMGSWNDMGFQGAVQAEYERLSDRLFELLNEAVEAAASSSVPRQPAGQ
ncbi:MAG: hypothetical protein ACRD3S_08985 [Terracidiphilus sp.]